MGDAQGKGFKGRIIIARRLGLQLVEPTERIGILCNNYASQTHSVDGGFRLLIDHAPKEVNGKPETKQTFCNFFNSIRQLDMNAQIALGKTQTMIDSIGALENLSRDLRPVLRHLRQGLTILVESREVMDEWVRLIEASGLEC